MRKGVAKERNARELIIIRLGSINVDMYSTLLNTETGFSEVLYCYVAEHLFLLLLLPLVVDVGLPDLLHVPVPAVLLHVDAGLLAVDNGGGEVGAVVTKGV